MNQAIIQSKLWTKKEKKKMILMFFFFLICKESKLNLILRLLQLWKKAQKAGKLQGTDWENIHFIKKVEEQL